MASTADSSLAQELVATCKDSQADQDTDPMALPIVIEQVAEEDSFAIITKGLEHLLQQELQS